MATEPIRRLVGRFWVTAEALVAKMGDVPDKAGQEMTAGVRHCFYAFHHAFRYQKAASKLFDQARIKDFHQEINRLSWSDPVWLAEEILMETTWKQPARLSRQREIWGLGCGLCRV